MPDGTPARSSVSPDLLHLLRMMSIRSEVVNARLSESGSPAGDIMEIGAAPSILDRLVEARARTAAPHTLLPETPPAAAEPELQPDVAELQEADADLLDMVASEAGQPPAVDPSPATALIEELPAAEIVETVVEADELLALDSMDESESSVEELHTLEPDEPADEIGDVQPAMTEGDQGPTSSSSSRQEPDYSEGPGDDFQALLAGSRPPEEADAAGTPPGEEEEDIGALLPASAEARLRARNGPKPGAEFSGKTTLAGAGGVYCLVERFDLPAGTRMKVTLSASRLADQVEVQDAVISRVRKAPGDAAEVQLAFDAPHPEVEEFVERHYGDKPVGFSFFGRRRGKR